VMLGRVFGADPAIAARRRHAFSRGMRAVAPATIATGTWGLVTGVAMVKIGLTPAQALGMTLLVFAGSAQLAALPLIAAAAPIWVVLLTATVVNLRFVIFSAGLQPFFRRFSLRRRLLQIPQDADGKRHIDLFVVSHIDHDHIGGARLLLGDDELGLSFDDIWFNAPPRPRIRRARIALTTSISDTSPPATSSSHTVPGSLPDCTATSVSAP